MENIVTQEQSVVGVEEMYLWAAGYARRLKQQPVKTHATLVCLLGELGSGKTAFVQGLAKALGVQDTVTSPTFVIQKMYTTTDGYFSKLVHIDAYRLESEREKTLLRIEETLADPHTLVCVEWPTNLFTEVPLYAKSLTFSFITENVRSIA
jgi:tRNA threonylcarbamoyl adenosine modification protein YjeE